VTVPEQNLNERVYDELRSRILTRRQAPGEKLSLHHLSSELGVSRSPVHHALTRLVSEGLLSVKARHGYYVTPVTAEALVEGYDALVTEHRRIVVAFALGDLELARTAIAEHIGTGRRIALEAIARAGGVL